MRWVLFLASLAAALGLAVLTAQTPQSLPASAPAVQFSAARAMMDVNRIARAPHPVGSVEHRQVQTYLVQRLTALGLQPSLQTGALSPAAVARIEREGGNAGGVQAVNIVGILPGRDPGLPAVVLMAHYDSVPNSPGAADDATGVAAILEAVRAIKARGGAERTLVVLFTDAEELNLDGARAFFSEHPLRDDIGAVINLEARGGGGRAMMFETEPGNAQTIARYAQATHRATGGPSSNALAIFVYRLMPNGTDFTVTADRRLAGINLAFIGRPAQYHSPSSTPQALDQGSVQHIGSQSLEMADDLLRAPTLPQATQNAVYADVFGLFVVQHSPAIGWVLLIVAALATGFAAWGARHATGLRGMSVVKGALGGLWLLASAVVVGQAVRVLAGPVGSRIASAETYYTLLRRLPVLEIAVALAIAGLVLALVAGRARIGRRIVAGVIIGAAVVATALGGLNVVVIGATVVAVGLSLWPAGDDETTWGGWLGAIALVLILGGVVQAVAPEAAFILLWPGLIAALAAAVTAIVGARLTSWRAPCHPSGSPSSLAAGSWFKGMGCFWASGWICPALWAWSPC
ncbi:M20/M25/M40 family metallo-hydrolase [Brevundimonas vesicularis]|uniref:M20/M25/M40 family metallo-hydrolase n=1 Tax=Brevundimonas vesicularis TaxID=41276 RepID=UPI00384CA69E